MKTLIIVRHAEAESPLRSDFSRCLTARGEQEAKSMGAYLVAHQYLPDRIIASAAARTRQTAQLLAQACEYEQERIEMQETLYNADSGILLKAVEKTPKDCQSLLLVAHNPGVSMLIAYFCGDAYFSLPTCGMVGLEFLVDDWYAIERNMGVLKFFEYPGRT